VDFFKKLGSTQEKPVLMKKYLLLLAAAPFLFISSCGSDDEVVIEPDTTLDLVFKANYGADVAAMQEEFTYGDGKAIKFVQLDFYVANIALMQQNTPESPETELKEIDFVNLSFTNQEDAEAGYTISLDQVPAGNYAGMKIGIGIPADLNRTVPEDYGSNHVLSKNSHYWEGWESYIFAKIEAGADLDGQNGIVLGGANSEGLSYHMGTDEVYYEVIIPQTIELIEDVPFSIDLNVDLNEVFKTTNPLHDTNGDGYLDIETFKGTHTEDNLSVAKKLMENLGNSITLDF